jgi:hypothetical protein
MSVRAPNADECENGRLIKRRQDPQWRDNLLDPQDQSPHQSQQMTAATFRRFGVKIEPEAGKNQADPAGMFPCCHCAIALPLLYHYLANALPSSFYQEVLNQITQISFEHSGNAYRPTWHPGQRENLYLQALRKWVKGLDDRFLHCGIEGNALS